MYLHLPVLVKETVELLVARKDGLFVDGTVGFGGHSVAIAGALGHRGRLICLDQDPVAVRESGLRLAAVMGKRARVVRANFVDLDGVLSRLGIERVDGVLLDLGMSSFHLDASGRGFSFSRDEPLDMRMDPDNTTRAEDLVNSLSLEEIQKILRDYGEERHAKAVARAIVNSRRKSSITTTSRLAGLVKSAVPPARRPKGTHPATRAFQAFRIAVNNELDNLKVFLKKVPSLLVHGGRLVVLSYHSLEDRIVKQAMVNWERGCVCPPDIPVCACGRVPVFRRLSRKVIRPSVAEVKRNPRARSAVLRAAERVDQ